MPSKPKPTISPLINLSGNRPTKPNPNRSSVATPALAQPSGMAPRKASADKSKTVDPQFGVTLKKKAVAQTIAKKKAAIKREAY